jgi:sortase A
MKLRLATALIAAAVGVACVAEAGWIYAKGLAAQALIAAAWARTEAGAPDARPWPWADTRPVARLQLGQGATLFVLEGSSGRNLAFGPTHDPASVLPGDAGNSVIAGHRDTHFGVLERVSQVDRLRVDRPDGRTLYFEVSDVRIVDSREKRIGLDADSPRLTLVTCYPFDAINPGGPLRFVVTADLIAGAGNTPPRQVARAVSFSRRNQNALSPVSSRPTVSW